MAHDGERLKEIKNCLKEDGEFTAEASIECTHCYKQVTHEQDLYEFENAEEELINTLTKDLLEYGWEVQSDVRGRVKYLVCSECKGNQNGN